MLAAGVQPWTAPIHPCSTRLPARKLELPRGDSPDPSSSSTALKPGIRLTAAVQPWTGQRRLRAAAPPSMLVCTYCRQQSLQKWWWQAPPQAAVLPLSKVSKQMPHLTCTWG